MPLLLVAPALRSLLFRRLVFLSIRLEFFSASLFSTLPSTRCHAPQDKFRVMVPHRRLLREGIVQLIKAGDRVSSDQLGPPGTQARALRDKSHVAHGFRVCLFNDKVLIMTMQHKFAGSYDLACLRIADPVPANLPAAERVLPLSDATQKPRKEGFHWAFVLDVSCSVAVSVFAWLSAFFRLFSSPFTPLFFFALVPRVSVSNFFPCSFHVSLLCACCYLCRRCRCGRYAFFFGVLWYLSLMFP